MQVQWKRLNQVRAGNRSGCFDNRLAFHAFLGLEAMYMLPERYPFVQGAFSELHGR